MGVILDFMGQDHKQCDEHFAAAEQAVDAGDWTQAAEAFAGFLEGMRRHFAMEEEALFPEFEAASGSSQGPTAVMRMEHEQMRALFASMQAALAASDAEQFLGDSETLLILMQQHNAKEEQILYPMSERVLAADDVLTRMQALER